MNISKFSQKIILAGVVGVSALVVTYLALNYMGFCFKECRMLTEEEKISIAIDYVLGAYPPVIDLYKGGEGDLVSAGRGLPDKPIYYSSVAEFISVNKNCCRVTRNGREGYTTRLEHRLVGSSNAFVEVRYAVRYLDENKAVRSEARVDFIAISNCGHPWSGI